MLLVKVTTLLLLFGGSLAFVTNIARKPTLLPPAFDWRDKGVIPPVSNQGQEGSSALFAVLAALEARYVIKAGKNQTLSENEIVNCCLDKQAPYSTSPQAILGCLVTLGGLEFDTCPKDSLLQRLTTIFNKPKVTDACTVPQSCVAEKILSFSSLGKNETLIAETLISSGPIVVLIDASSTSFQTYSGGVYEDTKCSTVTLDHTVLIVGYGVTSAGEKYWIVRNSWGASWGVDGYILMKRETNQCGIADDAIDISVQIVQ